jgi:hypothetical protein
VGEREEAAAYVDDDEDDEDAAAGRGEADDLAGLAELKPFILTGFTCDLGGAPLVPFLDAASLYGVRNAWNGVSGAIASLPMPLVGRAARPLGVHEVENGEEGSRWVKEEAAMVEEEDEAEEDGRADRER